MCYRLLWPRLCEWCMCWPSELYVSSRVGRCRLQSMWGYLCCTLCMWCIHTLTYTHTHTHTRPKQLIAVYINVCLHVYIIYIWVSALLYQQTHCHAGIGHLNTSPKSNKLWQAFACFSSLGRWEVCMGAPKNPTNPTSCRKDATASPICMYIHYVLCYGLGQHIPSRLYLCGSWGKGMHAVALRGLLWLLPMARNVHLQPCTIWGAAMLQGLTLCSIVGSCCGSGGRSWLL